MNCYSYRGAAKNPKKSKPFSASCWHRLINLMNCFCNLRFILHVISLVVVDQKQIFVSAFLLTS